MAIKYQTSGQTSNSAKAPMQVKAWHAICCRGRSRTNKVMNNARTRSISCFAPLLSLPQGTYSPRHRSSQLGWNGPGYPMLSSTVLRIGVLYSSISCDVQP